MEGWSFEPARPEEGRRARDWVHPWFNQSCSCNETPIKKNSGYQHLGECPICGANWYIKMQEVMHCDFTGRGQRELCVGSSHRPCPMSLFICLVLFCILYDKTVVVSITLSWILWGILVNYQNPLICSWLFRSAGGLGTLNLECASEVRAALWG